MSLIGRLVDKLLDQGQHHPAAPGQAAADLSDRGGGKHLTVRFTDRKVAFDIVAQSAPRRRRSLYGRPAGHRGRDDPRPARAGRRLQPLGGQGRGPSRARQGQDARLRTAARRNTPTRARRNVAHHYDLKDELYELFLDDDKQYSCAYFTDPGNSLEQAQADKKAHIAAKLALEPGQRVLDIGCGWGGMALYLHQVAGVDVLGITLSEHQLKIARAARRGGRRGRPCEVRADRLSPCSTSTFDRIVSVGMFEHVGATHYDEFFAKCRELLKPDGVMLLHTIGKLGEASQRARPVHRQIDLPRLSSAVAEPDDRRRARRCG